MVPGPAAGATCSEPPQTAALVCLLDDLRIGRQSSKTQMLDTTLSSCRSAAQLQTQGIGLGGSGRVVRAAVPNNQTS